MYSSIECNFLGVSGTAAGTLTHIQWEYSTYFKKIFHFLGSGVARAFPDGRFAHLEGQNEDKNKESVRKN